MKREIDFSEDYIDEIKKIVQEAIDSSSFTLEGNLKIVNDGTEGNDYFLTSINGGTEVQWISALTLKTNLNLLIGTDIQEQNENLQSISGLTPSDGGIIVGNGISFVMESESTARDSLGLGTIATQNLNSVSITGGSISGITDLAVTDGGTGASDASTARTNLGLAIGVNVQAYSSNLNTVSIGNITADDRFLFSEALSGNVSWVTPSAARDSLGLGTIATQNLDSVSITGGSISGLTSLSNNGNTTLGDTNADQTIVRGILQLSDSSSADPIKFGTSTDCHLYRQGSGELDTNAKITTTNANGFSNEVDNGTAILLLQCASGTSNFTPATIELQRSRGTALTAPGQTSTGDTIGSINYRNYNTSWVTAGIFRARQTNTFASAQGTLYWEYQTLDSGGSLVQIARIDRDKIQSTTGYIQGVGVISVEAEEIILATIPMQDSGFSFSTGNNNWIATTTVEGLYCPVSLAPGSIVTGFVFKHRRVGADARVTYRLKSRDDSGTGTAITTISSGSLSGTVSTVFRTEITLGSALTLVAGTTYWIEILAEQTGGSFTSVEVWTASVITSRRYL